ncbi:MAG: hypothetical protein WD928_01140 [Gammaproteobacteria bacterium]
MSTEYLRQLLQDAHVVELRHQHGERWASGTFSNLADLERAIRERQAVGNLYTSLNRPDVKARNGFSARPLRDEDMTTICRIVFDLDPKRPAGTASTEPELQAATKARDLVVCLLSTHGWPTPATAISGNGAHVVYRTLLVNSLVWRQSAAALYAGLRLRLAAEMEDLGVDFDTTVRNPARIWRLYGTENRKGEATADRPHRQATIRLPAGGWQTVKAAVIERTVAALTPVVTRVRQARPHAPVDGQGDYATLDIVSWFAAHGAYRRPLVDGKHAVTCPWSHEHSTTSQSGTDSVIWESAGDRWPTFHCSHSHCDGRTLRDVLALWGGADPFCTRIWEGRRNG